MSATEPIVRCVGIGKIHDGVTLPIVISLLLPIAVGALNRRAERMRAA